MTKGPVTPTPNAMNDLVRANLKRLRGALTQAEAAELSGVPLDAIRRYETGQSESVPATVLKQLGEVYGHPVDHFFLAEPPAAKPEDQPTYFLRRRPGAQVDAEVDAEVRAAIERANTRVRSRKPKR